MFFEYGSFWSCLVRQYGLWAGPIQRSPAPANPSARTQRTPSRGYISREMFPRVICVALADTGGRKAKLCLSPSGDSVTHCFVMNILFSLNVHKWENKLLQGIVNILFLFLHRSMRFSQLAVFNSQKQDNCLVSTPSSSKSIDQIILSAAA